MNLSILGKVDGAWQSLGTTTVGDNSSSVTLGDDYIYNNIKQGNCTTKRKSVL